jgi:hypothetical protein
MYARKKRRRKGGGGKKNGGGGAGSKRGKRRLVKEDTNVSNTSSVGHQQQTLQPMTTKRIVSTVASTPLKISTKTIDITKQATRTSATMATKLVTGLDLNGFSAAQQKEREEEEEEQRREYVQNSIGQPVYIGASARKQRLSSDSMNGTTAVRSSHLGVDAGVPIPENAYDEFGMNGNVTSDNEGDVDQEYDNDKSDAFAHPQDRGNPFLGWIPWTLHLSYDRMLRGIPGTGTRDGGMGGKLLGVNLDAIVLFRFHGE